jgi:FkbM family methyltransferase
LRERTGDLLEAAFIDLATGLVPTLSVEIGAHEASFSEQLKTNLPNLHALAFEANPYVYSRHADRLRQEATSVDYRHAAICSEDGTVQLQIPVTLSGTPINPHNAISSLLRRVSAEFEYEPVLVPAFALDTALEPFAVDRSVAWIDAEGAQSEVLAGGRLYFARVAALYIEVEREQYWCDQKLDRKIAESLAEFSLAPIMRDNLANGQYNEVYIRPDDDIVDAVFPSVLCYTEELRRLVGMSGDG